MSLRELAAELIEIPSHDDPGPAGDAIEAWLREETDASVTRDAVGNVIARRGAGPGTLALVGHHDVVPPAPAQLAEGRYVVREADGRLFGRGSADMKGSVAAAMLAFRDADPAVGLTFASFVGEEVGGVGARHAVDEGFAPDHAVICEGSTGYSGAEVTDVVVAHRGRRLLALTARGESAHAGEPDAGENAIEHMCETVVGLRDLEPPVVEIAGEDLAGSLTVTGIAGGEATNVVPAGCEADLDERTVPGADSGVESAVAGEAMAVEITQETPAMRCGDAMFAGHALRAADAVQDGRPRHVTKPHATDAGHLAAAGTACVVIGAAEPGEAHTDEESVSIATLQRCRRCYEELATTWSP